MIKLVKLHLAKDAHAGLGNIEMSEAELSRENLTIESFIDKITNEKFIKIHKNNILHYFNTNYITSMEILEIDENSME